ncbi:Gldg family protein [soil metagenome]
MSKVSKASLLFAGLFAVAVVVIRLILGGWTPLMWIPLGLSLALFVFAIVRDWRLMLEFLTLKTTKHGMNMGVLILTMFVFLVAANFLAVARERKWDWTSEGLNSLSEQSVKAVENLKVDTDIVLLYRKAENDETTRRQVSDLATLYMNASPKVHLKVYNALERPDLSQKYEYKTGPFAVFLVQNGDASGVGERHMKVDQVSEEEITRTFLRFARDKKKIVYFISGHDEHDLTLTGQDSISQYKADLELSYDVKKLELFKSPKVPEDADLVIVAGPRTVYLASEVEALRDYAKRGGHLMLLLDPDAKHGLAGLTKTFGVEYQNNYVLDPRAMIPGAGNIAALGNEFSATAEATKSFRSGFTVFLIASALKKAPDVSKDIVVDEIVRTDETPIATDRLSADSPVRVPGPHTLGTLSKGKLPGATKDFEVIIYGDSDFLRDNLYRNNLNRDLAMNSTASLAKDSDLVTIRPKTPKGTQLSMTQPQTMIFLLGFLIPIPIIMFFTSGILWWRRKSA